MAARKSSGGTPAVSALDRASIGYQLHSYQVDPDASSYGLAAAAALGVPPSHLFKTLLATVDDRLFVAVVPVDQSLDLKALATAAGGKKAVMAEPAAAERATGYVVGGISPLGQRRTHPTVIDVTAPDLETLYVSAGRRGLQLQLAPADLVRLTRATVAPIARP